VTDNTLSISPAGGRWQMADGNSLSNVEKDVDANSIAPTITTSVTEQWHIENVVFKSNIGPLYHFSLVVG